METQRWSCSTILGEKEQQREDDNNAIKELMRDPVGKKAWLEHNHEEDDGSGFGLYTIPDQVFMDMDLQGDTRTDLQKQFDSIIDIR